MSVLISSHGWLIHRIMWTSLGFVALINGIRYGAQLAISDMVDSDCDGDHQREISLLSTKPENVPP